MMRNITAHYNDSCKNGPFGTDVSHGELELEMLRCGSVLRMRSQYEPAYDRRGVLDRLVRLPDASFVTRSQRFVARGAWVRLRRSSVTLVPPG